MWDLTGLGFRNSTVAVLNIKSALLLEDQRPTAMIIRWLYYWHLMVR